MLRWLELTILDLLLWFFELPPSIEYVTLAPLAVILLIIQYNRQKETFLPGFFGLIVGWAAFAHIFRTDRLLFQIESWREYLFANGGIAPMGWAEPIFQFLAGPAESRLVFEESIAVAILAYIASVFLHAFLLARKTGGIRAVAASTVFGKGKNPRPLRSRGNELGSGDFADLQSLSKWLKPSNKGGDTSFIVSGLKGDQGILFDQAEIFMPIEQRNRHVLVIAKTGSGKTTRVILPLLYQDCLCPLRSTIVIDSKPEMWRKLAAMTRKYNPEKEILLFNPLDKARSLSWNILAKIEDDTDAKLIANTIIMATDNPSAKSDSPFFRNNALALLNSIMVGLLHDKTERLSMPRVHELVQSGMKPLCDWLEKHPNAYRNSRTFVELARSGSQNADTIMSELSMRLSAWDLTAIRSTTFHDELDLEKLIQKPTLLIVELRESELEMLRPMANVIVVEMLRFLTKRAEQYPSTALPRPICLVIDEFASALGRIPDIHVKLNTLRSRNVSILAAIQSLGQLKANYGEQSDSVIAGFSTKIFIPTLELSDAEWASKESGQMTIRFQTASSGANRKIIEVFASKNENKQEQVQQRAVLTPDEIARPADNISTFFLPDTRVFQGHLTPYYQIPEMIRRIKEFDSDEAELKMRSSVIEYEEDAAGQSARVGANGTSGNNNDDSDDDFDDDLDDLLNFDKPPKKEPLPPTTTTSQQNPGITDTTGMSDASVWKLIEKTRAKLDWDGCTGSARKWWQAFEDENRSKPSLVLRLAEELNNRKATISEFFMSYVYSNSDNIQANLHYLDYSRSKKEDEKRKKEEKERAASGNTTKPSVVN